MKLFYEKTLGSPSLLSRLALPALAIISVAIGFISGNMFKSNHHPTGAASADITVVDNDQLISQDQSTGEIIITRTSIVTIKNPEANYGYTLSAKLATITIPNATVAIASPTSTDCPADTPCLLNTATHTTILTTIDNAATSVDGDTTIFTVTITIPAETAMSDYLLDIEYAEEATIVLPLTDGETMQAATRQRCEVTPAGTMVNLKDTRDNTYYRVKKMPDGNCWMVDNLAFNLNKATNPSAPTYSPAAALISDTIISVDTVAQYILNNNVEGQGQIPNNGSPKASYLYNWCAALGDTSVNCAASANATDFQTVQNGAAISGTATSQPEIQGICPAQFRLPKGGLESSPESTPSSTANEFVKLDISMGGLGTNRNPADTFPNFNGTTADQKDWFGALSGLYGPSSLAGQGRGARWWSSTAGRAAGRAYNLLLDRDNQYVHPANYSVRDRGYAIRCLIY